MDWTALLASGLAMLLLFGLRVLTPADLRGSRERFVARAALVLALFFGSPLVFGPIGSLLSVLIYLGVFLGHARVVRHQRRMVRALTLAADPRRRAEGAALLSSIATSPPVSRGWYSFWANTNIYGGMTLALRGLFREAHILVAAVDPSRLGGDSSMHWTVVTWTCLRRLGRRAEAAELLAKTARPLKDPQFERLLAAQEAVIEAIDGDPSRAAATAQDGLATETSPVYRRIWLSAYVHALAAVGQMEEASALLTETVEHDEMFALVAAQEGPASRLAVRLLGGRREGGGYR